MKKLSVIILAIILFNSCEKETHVDYYIDNQSSGQISVNGSNIIRSTGIDQTINPNEKLNVAAWSKYGKQTDLFEPKAVFGNDLVITNSLGDTLTKDYKSLTNWNADIDNQRAVANHEYILIVTDTDF
ncbi:MAG: hypothetical protein KDC92_01075 [Bacteroidetes bacterium]|nr:hypothetical protein [Bacteroidota bacterium]